MHHLREFLLNKIKQTNDVEEIEILATFCGLVNYSEYVKELNPELHKKALAFGFETLDLPGISFTKEP